MKEETIKHIKKLREQGLYWKEIEEIVGYKEQLCRLKFYKRYPALKRKPKGNNLTNREIAVFNKIINDAKFKRSEIADALGLSNVTVQTYLDKIYQKLNVHSVAELIWAYYNGKIEKGLINET